jgi:protocatechuate 3,4-dioxygenase beta subunit
MIRILPHILIVFLLAALTVPVTVVAGDAWRCPPTRPDADGPFYTPGAPERSKVGHGYVLSGVVRAARDCAALPGAKIEIWLNGPDGRYGDAWRATLYADADGRYRFESHLPVPYGSRPPHIHLVVNADDYAELVTQHYPQPGSSAARFDLVLLPANQHRPPTPF